MATGVRFTRESAKRIGSVVKQVEAAPLDLSPHRRRSRGGAGGAFPWSKVCFGYSISGTTVTIYSGEVHHGINAVVEVAEADKDFSALGNNDYYVFVEYTFGSTAVIATPNATRPVSDVAIFRCWLYIFTKSVTTVTLKRVGHFGNIELPSTFEN